MIAGLEDVTHPRLLLQQALSLVRRPAYAWLTMTGFLMNGLEISSPWNEAGDVHFGDLGKSLTLATPILLRTRDGGPRTRL